MLGKWSRHIEYQEFVKQKLRDISQSDPCKVLEYEEVISKLYILPTDKLMKTMLPLYSEIGRPAELQPEIFRSFVAMKELGFTLDNWIVKLRNNEVLRTAVGITENIPCASSHYDFINRIIDMDERPKIRLKKRKPTKKLGKNTKLPNKNPGIVQRLVDKILCGRRFNLRPERHLQQIFADVAVTYSRELGIIPDEIEVSGDGTCIETGASHYGVKICECKDFRCDCPRRFSDPNATWGWDSHNERYFYGYTGYFISTYNRDLKADLPLYLRLVEAKRHDSVSAVVALAELRDLYPDLKLRTFIHDSAADNTATYELLHNWNIDAVIALNQKGNFKYPPHLKLNDDGTPVCMGGHNMVRWGKCPDRDRIKFRCPFRLGKVSDCACAHSCSSSDYGRTIYIYPKWDLRLFTNIPRGSAVWKLKMKSRTSVERINQRILHDYAVEFDNLRGKKRISFAVTIAALNIHLDVWLNLLSDTGLFDFSSLFIQNLA
ncbi:MAG: hypothetical protein FWH05_09600 [Oscillospiraceae bacterium]|nr:hypothetical protein [Oscillospiraceae bacterium]